jgi:hypothetical protein
MVLMRMYYLLVKITRDLMQRISTMARKASVGKIILIKLK